MCVGLKMPLWVMAYPVRDRALLARWGHSETIDPHARAFNRELLKLSRWCRKVELSLPLFLWCYEDLLRWDADCLRTGSLKLKYDPLSRKVIRTMATMQQAGKLALR